MKIKVLHITKIKAIMGSENHLLTLLSGLDKDRFEVHYCILAEARHLSCLADYQKRLEQAGIKVVIFVIRKYGGLSLLWALKKYIFREQFHIVHTHLIHADVYGTLAAKFAGVPVIISSRHNDDRFRHNKVLIGLNKLLARWHAKVIVISDWVGTFLRDVEGIPTEKIVRIHYGLQPEPISVQADPQYIRQQLQIPDGIPVIGTIGRLTKQKGQVYLLQAIKHVIKHFPDLRVVIVGEGELRPELEQQAQILGIDPNVIFTGYRPDATKLLSGFDFFVFPSLWEGFGLVLLEAMALQKAIVASRVSAIPESVIDEKTGILVPPENVAQLAEVMLRLLSNRELQRTLGEAGYQYLQESFGVKRMIESTERLYTSVMKSFQEQKLSKSGVE
jgi:glycosyltransferase involved in cell wall biosynthesis